VIVDVMTFLGREGWSAASIDPTGANLPPEHGPWTPFRTVSITESAELADLTSKGFHLARRTENEDG